MVHTWSMSVLRLIVVYLRVSTRKQGEHGLGMEAQRTVVARYQATEKCVVLAEFVEVETGKSARRPKLAAAIALCRQTGATLLVAKLDRLARNVAFTSALMDSGVDFVACDLPFANRLTIHIMAAMAEDEARRISDRTRSALAELKAQGVALGSARPGHWDGREHLRGWKGLSPERAAEVKRVALDESYGTVLPVIRVLRERGVPYSEVAKALNDQGFVTPKGCQYRAGTVQSIYERDASLTPA